MSKEDRWVCPLNKNWAKFERESHMFGRMTNAKKELETHGNITRHAEIAGRRVELVATVGGPGVIQCTASWSPDKPDNLDVLEDAKYTAVLASLEVDVTLRVEMTISELGAFSCQWRSGPPSRLSADQLESYMRFRDLITCEMRESLSRNNAVLRVYERSIWN